MVLNCTMKLLLSRSAFSKEAPLRHNGICSNLDQSSIKFTNGRGLLMRMALIDLLQQTKLSTWLLYTSQSIKEDPRIDWWYEEI